MVDGRRILMIKIFFICFFYFSSFNLHAGDTGSETGFKIPRFVSLKSNDVNLRKGSSTNYPIVLKYTNKNLPIEIIDEYDHWRKTIDIEGNQGWIHKNLIKGNRFAITNQNYISPLQIKNKPQGRVIGTIGKNNIVKINKCFLDWCSISHENKRGWVEKINLWGVYKYEKFNIPFYQPLINQLWKINF
jgi:SH3-like domain-containing protein